MIWKYRFSLGKKYNIFVEVVLPPKQKKLRSSLIGDWYKYKDYKISKGENVERFLKLEHGILFGSEVYYYDSVKVIQRLQKSLNALCNGELFSVKTDLVPITPKVTGKSGDKAGRG